MHANGTLGYYIENGETISAHHALVHPPCSHSSELDLEALARKLGYDFNIIENRTDFLAMLRCKKCGRKGNMSIILSPPNRMNGRKKG